MNGVRARYFRFSHCAAFIISSNVFVHLLFHFFFAEMTFLAAHAGGHPSGCPHRAGLILFKKIIIVKIKIKKDSVGSVASFSINGTLRGADVITDHGAEYVVLAQWLPASLTLPHVVSIFSFIRTFLCFLGSPSSAAPEKKKKKDSPKFHDRQVPQISASWMRLSRRHRSQRRATI